MYFILENFYKIRKTGKILINNIILCKDEALTYQVCIVQKEYSYKKSMINEHIFFIYSLRKNLWFRFWLKMYIVADFFILKNWQLIL